MISASPASTPTRRASCGVNRYGSAVRGSGGRKRPDGERRSGYELAKELDLADAVAERRAVERAAAEGEHRPRDGEVEHEGREQRLEEGAPGRELLAEEEVEAVAGVGDRNRGDEHGQERRVRAVAAGRLAVAAGPVARQRVEERSHAERVERHYVDEEPCEEAGRRADNRPAQERDREEREQEHVGDAAGDVERREDRDLEQGGDEDDRRDDGALGEAHGSSGCGRRGTSTSTASRAGKSTSDSISTCCQRSVLSPPTKETRPI